MKEKGADIPGGYARRRQSAGRRQDRWRRRSAQSSPPGKRDLLLNFRDGGASGARGRGAGARGARLRFGAVEWRLRIGARARGKKRKTGLHRRVQPSPGGVDDLYRRVQPTPGGVYDLHRRS